MKEERLNRGVSDLELQPSNSNSRVDLNNLIKKVKDEEKRSKRQTRITFIKD